jgi:hypothetical protein
MGGWFKKRLTLISALTWIVGSIFLTLGSAYPLCKYLLRLHYQKMHGRSYQVMTLIQTGPQKEALKTPYLAELMGLATDCPISIYQFDPKKAQEDLLNSPLIKEAQVKRVPPQTVYVDYTVRQPIAHVYDYENIAMDEEGYLFPLIPFFPPKRLPEIYFAFPPIQTLPKYPLKGRAVDLALSLLRLLSESTYRGLFNVVRIDVSHAFAESYGLREIVLIVEDEILCSQESREVCCIFPRYLRLSLKNYPGELGNYLKLRQELLEKEKEEAQSLRTEKEIYRFPAKSIDFRISQLAFMQTVDPSQ